MVGGSLGSSQIVNKLMKGIFNTNPPTPKYISTWDPILLLNFIETLGNNSEMSMEHLSKKVVCLLALCKASRSSDICALDIGGLKVMNNGFVFQHVHLRKTSNPSRLPNSFYPKFADNPLLCVVSAVNTYMDRTKDIRKSTRLILTTRKPYGNASSRTVARWIIDFMQNAGVDTTKFKAHSIRSASTSKAFSKGVSLDDIQQAADWSGNHTFFKFYCRQGPINTFAPAVLSK